MSYEARKGVGEMQLSEEDKERGDRDDEDNNKRSEEND